MYRAGICILLAYAALSAQSSAPSATATADLHATLLALKEARVPASSLNQRLADDMMALATGDRRPSRAEVAAFSGELTHTLRGAWHAQPAQTPLRTGDLSRNATEIDTEASLQQCLVDIVRVSNSTNLGIAERLRRVLTQLRINDSESNLLIRRFLAIGESVRGPDDSPLDKE
jgi:hypothetical protein